MTIVKSTTYIKRSYMLNLYESRNGPSHGKVTASYKFVTTFDNMAQFCDHGGAPEVKYMGS